MQSHSDGSIVRPGFCHSQVDIGEFQREAQDGKDPALKAFAQKYLPILQQHLEMAEDDEPTNSGGHK